VLRKVDGGETALRMRRWHGFLLATGRPVRLRRRQRVGLQPLPGEGAG
jgi:hypothetical protein